MSKKNNSPSNDQTDSPKPLWKKKRVMLPALVLGLAGAAGASGSSDTTTSQAPDEVAFATEPEPEAVDETVNTAAPAAEERTAISLEEIKTKSDGQTDAQWEAFADELEAGYRAEDWTGYVVDVREQTFGDDYYVQLSATRDGLIDFNKDLTADEALTLSKGDQITVSGDIKRAFRAFGVHIELAE